VIGNGAPGAGSPEKRVQKTKPAMRSSLSAGIAHGGLEL